MITVACSATDKALADINKAIGLDPKDAEAWNSRGATYFKLQQYDKALADINKAIELDPKDAVTWSNRGFIYDELRQFDKALADLTKAIELDPKNAKAWNNRGATHINLRQYDRALADLTKAIELDPKNAATWSYRGQGFANLGQCDKAIADFSKAVEVDPENPYPWYARALVHLQLGDRGGFRKACAAMRQHFSASGNSQAVYWTAWTCIQVRDAVDDWTPLVPWAEKALAADPKKSDWLTALGAVLYRAGRFEAAAQRLTEAEAAFRNAKVPVSTIAYTWLFMAMTRERLGQTEQAKQWLAKAVREIEQPPAERAKDPGARIWNRKLTLQLLRGEAEALIDRADHKAHRKGSTDTEKKP
jgi:tetratricopeptide (TPR) repeat protein